MARPLTDIEAGKAHLLDLIEHMIRERGGAAVNLSELAAEAGMSPANVYRFFDSKEALYEAVAKRWFAPKIAIMEEVTAVDGPIEKRLFDFFARRFVLMRDNYLAEPDLFKRYLELGDEHQETVRGYVDLGDHYLAILVAQAMEEGYFQGLTIDQAVSLVNLMLMPFINPWQMIELMHSVTEEKLKTIILTILKGLEAANAAEEERPRLALVG
jgi:TetR/AcrR family transcriptional regulator, repressor of the ameABC operon